MYRVIFGLVAIVSVVNASCAGESEQPSQPAAEQPSETQDATIVVQELGYPPQSVETKEELSEHCLGNWQWLEYDGMQIAIGVKDWSQFGESYIDVFGYVYNQHFEEWRRFLVANTRNTYGVEALIEEDEGMLRIICNSNSSLEGKTIILWNLEAISDDRLYLH